MKNYRIEKDSIGNIKIPLNKYWGTQTERSRNNFKIGPNSSMPFDIIKSLALIKKASAYTNCHLGVLSQYKRDLISNVCEEIIEGKLNKHFPLVIWQTGSGTHSNMNINEVISNRSHVINGGNLNFNEKKIIHPNDDVNKSQSSNDTYSSAMNISAYEKLIKITIPSIQILYDTFKKKSNDFKDIIKIGRTHMMDATPLTLGQVFSGYTKQLYNGLNNLKKSLDHISEISLGGTAVGNGINTPEGYDKKVAYYISKFTNFNFKTAENKFEALSSHDALINAHSSLKQLSISLMKIANDIRLLASGPHCGIGEILLPVNEEGSSIMPGKINPTQCEAITMVCAQIMGNDTTISISGSLGNCQLNVFKPVIAYNFLQSAELLGNSCISFNNNCIKNIKPNIKRIKELVNKSLMLATYLTPHIGYEKSSIIVKKAYKNNTNLKEEAIKSGYVSSKEFDSWTHIKK